MREVCSERDCVYVGAEGMLEISMPSAQFYCELNTALSK